MAAKWFIRCLQRKSIWKQLMFYIIMNRIHINNIRDSFRLCGIIWLPWYFKILKSLVLKGIWEDLKVISSMIVWEFPCPIHGCDLPYTPIWTWKILKFGHDNIHQSRHLARKLNQNWGCMREIMESIIYAILNIKCRSTSVSWEEKNVS